MMRIVARKILNRETKKRELLQFKKVQNNLK